MKFHEAVTLNRIQLEFLVGIYKNTKLKKWNWIFAAETIQGSSDAGTGGARGNVAGAEFCQIHFVFKKTSSWKTKFWITSPFILHISDQLSPHIRLAGIIISHSLQMRVLLENTTFLLHKVLRFTGTIRIAGIIRGRALYTICMSELPLGFQIRVG